VKLPSFEHTCPACVFLGTAYDLLPPFLGMSTNTVPFGDFYRCPLDGPGYVLRYGSRDGDVEAATTEYLKVVSYVDIVRGRSDLDRRMQALKIVSLLDSFGRVDDGFAVVSLIDDPGAPHVVTSPLLLPHEHELIHRVAPAAVGQFGRGRQFLPMIADAIHGGLQALANRHGYVTRWNMGEAFVPPEVEEPSGEAVV